MLEPQEAEPGKLASATRAALVDRRIGADLD